MKSRINSRNRRKEVQPKQSFALKASSVILAMSMGTFASAAWLVNGGSGAAEGTITVALQSVFKVIKEQYNAVVTSFDSQMAAMDAAVAAAFNYENEQLSSAMQVFVKQMSVSSNLLAENAVKVAQSEAAVEQARMQKDRIVETNERVGPAAQGHKVCTVLAERQDVSKISTGNAKNVPSLTTQTVYAAPGAYGDPHAIQQKMNLDHSTNYCTPEQAASGYCSSATDQAGWDLMTSTLFTPTTTDSSVYAAQNALINNMIGLPDAPISENIKGSPTASNYLSLKQKKDAIISPAIHSLKSIQAEFAGMSTPDSPSKVSPIKAVDDQVKRYLGSGEEYQSWNKTLVAAPEDGIMRELLQINALDLHLLMRQYKQYEREELILAGIVAATQQLVDQRKSRTKSGYRSDTEAERARIAAKEISSKFGQKFLN